MASGFGYTGGTSRCFAYWQAFAKCYQNIDDNPGQCKLPLEDYMECLHHTKEISRAKEIKARFIEKTKREATERRKAGDILSDGVIVSLGIIGKENAGGTKST